MTVSRSTRDLLSYLSRYVAATPGADSRLEKLHLKLTKRRLDPSLRWRHCAVRVQPNMDTSLVYLCFLHAEGVLVATDEPGKLFSYTRPELLGK